MRGVFFKQVGTFYAAVMRMRGAVDGDFMLIFQRTSSRCQSRASPSKKTSPLPSICAERAFFFSWQKHKEPFKPMSCLAVKEAAAEDVHFIFSEPRCLHGLSYCFK